MSVAAERRPAYLDTWMALLAGERVWNDAATERPSTREQVAGAFMVTALALTVLMQWTVLASRVDLFGFGDVTDHEQSLELLAVGGTLAAALLAIRPLTLALGRRASTAGFWWSLTWRGVTYVVLIASTSALLPRFRFLGAVPLGLVGGADATLTLWALGVPPLPKEWLKRLVLSPIHFGALGALIGTVVFDPDGPSTATALGVYAAMWTGIAVAAVAVLAINQLSARVDAERDADRRQIRERERELRVHWLHDDVLSEVKLATLRIESESDVDGARKELQELDHRLRIRQLTESMRGGQPHLYEILQPHLRRAQTLGVRLDRVPGLDRTRRRVDEASGQLVHRVVSNLMSNAVNAGARHASIDLREVEGGAAVLISVTDDAGGFDLDRVPAGRGLANLMVELGPGAVRRQDAPGGSTVTVRVPLSDPRPEEAGRP